MTSLCSTSLETRLGLVVWTPLPTFISGLMSIDSRAGRQNQHVVTLVSPSGSPGAVPFRSRPGTLDVA